MKLSSKHPDYLESYALLVQHIRAQLTGLSTTEKGRKFATFARKLIPQSEIGTAFEMPELSNKESHDGGVDLTAQSKDGERTLFIQSKLGVDRVDDIEQIIAKFHNFSLPVQSELPLFQQEDDKRQFLVVTLSPLSNLVNKYEQKRFPGSDFYFSLKQSNNIHFIDGYEILSLLKSAYGKLNQIPQRLIINFEGPYIQNGEVYIGVLSSSELSNLHKEFGDALFFENVRDFLGVRVEKAGRTTPNAEIVKTIKNNPERMLARNNGLVFGAEMVSQGQNENQLVLMNGSLVNGCQTTMCLVEYSTMPAFVLAKIVETSDAWDITKSANYQTAVPDIDLELARFLRPQLVKRAASTLGVQIQDSEKSAFQLLDEIYQRRIAYSETRLLYIGLFSRSPNNVFASNYTELMQDLIVEIHKSGIEEDEIFEILFLLQGISQECLANSKKQFTDPEYAEMFERLYSEESVTYRSFLSILALCGAVGTNIAARNPDSTIELGRMKRFLDESRIILTSKRWDYEHFYKLAVKLWMQQLLDDEDEVKIRRDMYMLSKRMNFTSLYRKFKVEADYYPSVAPPSNDEMPPPMR